MEIYLVRHGTTDWNIKHMIQGRSDTKLNEVGREMAAQTGKRFISEDLAFDVIYSSPLQRAYETASLLSPASDIITDDRLLELSFGPFEGKIVEDMISDPFCPFSYFKSAPHIYNKMVTDMKDPSLESLTQLIDRASSFLIEKIEPMASTDKKVLISGHGALNKGLMMHIRGEDDLSKFWGDDLQSNCGITHIYLDTQKYRVCDSNITLYDPSLNAGIKKLL